jgi:hypothetical protein
MKKKILIASMFLLLAGSSAVSAQDQDTVKKARTNYYSLSVGAGWSCYINSMQIGKNDINPNSAAVSLRFFWEPGNSLLSLGLETGYFRLFKAEKEVSPGQTSTAKTDVIPLTLLVRMHVIDHFYVTAGMGLAVTVNKVDLGETITNTTLSYSNYKFAASYLRPVSKKFFAGGELQFYNVGLTADWSCSVQGVFGVRLP